MSQTTFLAPELTKCDEKFNEKHRRHFNEFVRLTFHGAHCPFIMMLDSRDTDSYDFIEIMESYVGKINQKFSKSVIPEDQYYLFCEKNLNSSMFLSVCSSRTGPFHSRTKQQLSLEVL